MVRLPMPVAELSLRFSRFADLWCRDESPLYCSLGAAVAEDAALLDLLARCPRPQPTLFFAAVRFLGAPHDSYESFRAFVLGAPAGGDCPGPRDAARGRAGRRDHRSVALSG